MTRPSTPVLAGGAAALALLVWLLFWGVPAWTSRRAARVDPAAAQAAAEGRKINATLFFIGPDAESLVAVTRDIPYGATPAEQARHIVEAQLGAAPASHYSPIPSGTTLRGVFVSETGEAFVDLSPEASANHRGGSLSELFTVYSVVNAVTVSLPSVHAVQILVDGREVDTLAGHVDLRHPLPKNTTWVRTQ
ncbi:MAG: GerMN domain-containing protein [Acidobacteriota bacterium]|nr:GerMN domain-containing protein [Acidobacteriota bacterium]